MLGMYVHMHWSYRHPYAARTWDLSDWCGYLQGLRSLGYDFLMVWPMLDCMSPEPNASDLAFLDKLGSVIRMAQDDFGMRVGIVACANTIGNNVSGTYAFEERPYFAAERRVDPKDRGAVETLLAGRRRQFRPLRHADALVVIDSDPGGFVGSTNAEFGSLMAEQLDVFREANPQAELIYWMHFGWGGYGRFWEHASHWQPGDPPISLDPDPNDFRETLAFVREHIAEPWSLLCNRSFPAHVEVTEELGLGAKRCGFHYGLIEGEPTFPLTNCAPPQIAGALAGYSPADFPRGFMANAQTHALQLPHTYLVAHHWLNGPGAPPDLAAFGDQLLPGCGATLAAAWTALESGDPAALRARAADVRAATRGPHAAGAASGLLFGSADRFLSDLAMNLDVRAALAELPGALDAGSDPRPALRHMLADLRPYQERLGFTDAYGGPLYAGLNQPVARLEDPGIAAVLRQFGDWRDPAGRHGVLSRLLQAVAGYAESPTFA